MLEGPAQTVIKELMASCKGKAPGWGGGTRTRVQKQCLQGALLLSPSPGVARGLLQGQSLPHRGRCSDCVC